jgi:hypothetical protein
MAHWGRIVGGFLVAASGGAKLVSSVVLGQTSMAMFKANVTGQPIFFVAMLAVWVVILVGGLSLMTDGVSDLRRRETSAALS